MKRVILAGKVWEVRHLLKKYAERFEYVEEWIDFMDQSTIKNNNKIIPFPEKKEKTPLL